MGVPTSEVGYTPAIAMPRREDHEVHKDMWWHWTKKNLDIEFYSMQTLNWQYGTQSEYCLSYYLY